LTVRFTRGRACVTLKKGEESKLTRGGESQNRKEKKFAENWQKRGVNTFFEGEKSSLLRHSAKGSERAATRENRWENEKKYGFETREDTPPPGRISGQED